jgi:serine/threonine protein kinase
MYKTFNLDNPFAADLWSAGCAIFYIATGSIPLDTSGVCLLKAWLIAVDETAPSTWITVLTLIERGCMDGIIASGHDTLDSLIAGWYPYPDKQDFANFLRLILVMRPEKRANISVLLRQRWLQRSPGPLPYENSNPTTWTKS